MQAFSEAVRAIYDAALTPEAWPDALTRIAALFEAPGAVVYFASSDGETDFIASEGVREAVRIYQEENWGPRDVHALRLADMHLTNGDVVNDQLLVTDDEIATLPIYTDFFRRVGFGWIMTCPILPDLDMLVTVTVTRAKDRGAFGPAEMDKLQLIGRHVEQALRISLRVANLEATESFQRAALDAVDVAVLGLDDAGRLVFANAAGEAVFPELFVTIAERVKSRAVGDRTRFESILAAARAAESADAPPQCALLTRADGRRAAVWAAPIRTERPWRVGMSAPVRILLIVSAVERDRRLDPTVVRDAFHLSLGEARLAALIGDGLALRAAAERLGVTEGTARVVLKRVFRKLGVNRQAELALQLSALGGVRQPAAEGSELGAGEDRRRRRD